MLVYSYRRMGAHDFAWTGGHLLQNALRRPRVCAPGSFPLASAFQRVSSVYATLAFSPTADVLPLSGSVLVDRCDTETPDRIRVPCSVVHNEHECGHARPEILGGRNQAH